MENEPQGVSAEYQAKIDSVSPARRALVYSWCENIKKARARPRTVKAFERMRKNMDFAARGADAGWVAEDKYVVPILNRHINQSVAGLYAKNPTAVAKRRRQMMFTLWDGRADSLQAALQSVAMAQAVGVPQMVDPNAAALLMEVGQARQHEQQLTRMGKTMEILWTYYLSEQDANYKQQLKAMVRRAKVCGVAYLKIGYQRALEPRPEVSAQIADVTSKLNTIQGLMAKIGEGNLDEQAKEYEELRLLLEQLQAEPMLVAREGPVFDFPRADEITIDPRCRHLKTLTGARWASQLYEMSTDEVREIYGVDIGKNSTQYDTTGVAYRPTDDAKAETCARVHEVWDKKGRQVFTVCEGYPDFLEAPAEPKLKIERFWPVFPLVFNEIEHEEELYPPSDVEQAKHIQNEYNRSREALREHRIAARPYYAVSNRLEQEERKKLANHAAHEIISFNQLAPGEKVEDFLQRGPTAPIDPNLYEVEMIFNDLLRTVGTQEANLGGMSGGTATESSIAEQSRTVSQADNVDDLDELLTDVAKAFGQICLMELSKETVVEIVGPGAVWPDMPQSREEAAKDLLLEIKAGSSGRPNRAAELANLERGTPILIQIPGIKPEPLGRRLAELLELDPEELILEGAPSIMAINAMMSKPMGAPGSPGSAPGGAPTGDPASDPNAQGPQGGQNAIAGPVGTPGAQPGFPAPMPG
jgi:hypothetical protein